MKVKVKKLVNEAVLPTYSKSGDAAMDITAVSKHIENNPDFGYIEYGTGLAFSLPEDHFMDIRPRSSISNKGLILANSPGTLDSEYTGELKIRFKYIAGTAMYNIGDRIAQILILPRPKVEWDEVDELQETDRGSGGFGHSGN